MTVGRLGVSNPAANTSTLVYTVPSNSMATLNISAVNMGMQDSSLSVYITDNTSLTLDRLIESSVVIPANGGVLERQGVSLSPSESVYIIATSNNISVRINGFED